MSTNLNTQLYVAEEVLDPCLSSQLSPYPEANVGANCEIYADPPVNDEISPIKIEHCSEVYPVLLTALFDTIEDQPKNTNLCNVFDPNLQKDLVINSLTLNKPMPQGKINISEKEDEIVCMKEDKEAKEPKELKDVAVKVRRNPQRKVKSKQEVLKKDHLMEEDFAVLDKLDRASLVKGKDTKLVMNPEEAGSSKGKRPCNMKGKKMKPFEDVTNDSPNMPVENKRKRAPSTKAKKPIKKGTNKKRGRPAKKVPASDLIDLVSNTFEMVGKFVRDNKGTFQGGSKNDINALIRNQASLLAYVKGDYDRKKVTASVRDVLNQK